MADRTSTQIITDALSYGSKHDSQLFKDDVCKFSERLRIWQMLAIKDRRTP